MSAKTSRGRPHPRGATPLEGGVNFSLFSKHATRVELLLFERHDSPEPYETIALDPEANRTFFWWHVFVHGLGPGAHYAYRAFGPQEPGQGHRFDPDKVLLDPYSRGNTASLWDREAACVPGGNLRASMRSVVLDTRGYDWEDDAPPRTPLARTIVCEVHVGGYTRSATSGVAAPGTFRGLAEKAPYLKGLGVTAVELLPVMHYDGRSPLGHGPDGKPLRNYWGYGAVGFFAPHPGYCLSPEEGRHLDEFRDMVKALHRAGLEVILDVPLSRTGEGNERGPTISFRGLENAAYYLLLPRQPRHYADYTGGGNTLNGGHPVVERLIVECLEFWARDMRVDGFRLDKAHALARWESGALMRHPPALWGIELSEALADVKLIADSWDPGGAHQAGGFPGIRWAEWNGRFRDDVRRFVRGDPGLLGSVASRLAGSADLYAGPWHRPTNSLNYVACHEGFTLNDLVTYEAKRNRDNGESNNDGPADNLSWNCGREGETDDPDTEALRRRQVKNFAAVLLLAQGVPMILGGDEFRRTQGGNNNAWCQDNETSWVDWTRLERHGEVFSFFKRMIAFRRAHRCLQRERFFDGAINERALKDISWHGTALERPGWDDPQGRALAFTLAGFNGEDDLHVMMNMHWEPLYFELPRVHGRSWRRAVDTSLPSPDDAPEPGSEPPVEGRDCRVDGRSVVVLVSGEDAKNG